VQFQAEVATDGACFYALYDPSLLPAGLGNEFDDRCLEMPDDGRMFRYQEGGDGAAIIRVYVDEEPDDELVRMMQGEVTGSLLRVPTGRIILAAGENLPALASDNHEHEPPESHPLCAGDWSVPPGNYGLWAFNIDSALKHERVSKELTRFQRASIVVAESLLKLFGILGCASVVAAAAALITALVSDSETAKSVAIVCGGGIVVSIVLSLALYAIPPFKGAMDRLDEIRGIVPDVVVALSRLPADTLPQQYEPASLLYDDGLKHSHRTGKYEKMTREEQAIERRKAARRKATGERTSAEAGSGDLGA